MNITQIGLTSIELSGSGTGSIYGDFVRDGQHSPISEQLTLMVYLTLDATVGCPAGSFDIDYGNKHFSIGFVGEPEAYWDHVTGPGQSQQGTLHFQCGK